MIHSAMFHHFHNKSHPMGQGSLNESNLTDMLDWLRKRHRLISASDFKKRFESGTLSSDSICLSFDDALKCQYDIAVPNLEEYNLNAVLA